MKNGLFISLLLALLLSGPVFAEGITAESMQGLGREAASGDTGAIDKIGQAYDELFKNIDYQKEGVRVRSNYALMNAAFDVIGKSVKGNDTADPAFRSLVYALGKPTLGRFTVMPFGTAAAVGHQPSLDVLAHYKEHGMLLSTVVLAMQATALNNNKEAVDFLVTVINDESVKPLWSEASQGLVTAATQGNDEAKTAIAKARAYAASRGGSSY